MADDGGDRQIGARGYAVVYGITLPDYDKPMRPDPELLAEMNEHGPWTLTEWDGDRWMHVARVKDRSELERWLAGEPRAHLAEPHVTEAERAIEDRIDRHLDAAEQVLGWVGQRRREPYRLARQSDDRVRAFIELARLAADENPRRECWQALENAAEKLGLEDDDTERGEVLRLVRSRLHAPE